MLYIEKNGGLYITYHLSREAETANIDTRFEQPARALGKWYHLFASVHLNAEAHQNTTSRESYVMTHNSQISTAYTYSICCPMLGLFERIALLNYNPIWDEVVFWIPKDFTKMKFSSEATQLLLSAIQICWLRLHPKQKVHSGNLEG